MYYYAHSKKIYNTDREKEELKWLKEHIGEILNPNGDMDDFYNMDRYIKKVSECEGLACSEFKDCIGRGVFLEVQCALNRGQEVKCIRKKDGEFYVSDVKGVKVFDETDWKVKYGKLIVQEG